MYFFYRYIVFEGNVCVNINYVTFMQLYILDDKKCSIGVINIALIFVVAKYRGVC